MGGEGYFQECGFSSPNGPHLESFTQQELDFFQTAQMEDRVPSLACIHICIYTDINTHIV